MVASEHTLLGVRLESVRLGDILERVEQSVTQRNRSVFANLNSHGAYLYGRDSVIHDFYNNAALVWVDGMPLILLARLLGIPLNRVNRVTFLDLFPELCELASTKGWRIYYLGAAPGVAQRGIEALRRRYPLLQAECTHGHFSATAGSQDTQAILAKLRNYQPHLLMVGMGQPRQERWISENWDSLPTSAIFPLGACIDYFAGTIPAPPRWTGQIGLEWLFRLVSEPTRLWRRYLVEPFLLLPAIVRQFRSKRHPPQAKTAVTGWHTNDTGPDRPALGK